MKLHPLSVPYRAVSRGVTVASTLFFVGVVASGATDAVGGTVTLPLLAGGFLAGGAYEVAYYRRFEYDLTEDTFDITSGVFGRREREIPLHRIQNVDISQNLPQRAFGVAVLTIETAGGGETEATLRYVGYDEAKRLQSDLRRDADRQDPDVPAAETASTGDADPASEPFATDDERTRARGRDESAELLFSIRPHELIILSVASVNPGALVLSVLFFPYVELVDVSTLVAFAVPGGARPAITLVVTRLAALVLGAWLISAAMTLARYYDFTLSRVGDELRYERGLLQRYSGSIPLEKVQTVTVSDNPVTRTAGYATLVVETAGYAAGQAGTESAVPLADRERVYRLAQSVESFDDPEFTRPPKRALERYAVRYSLAVGALTTTLYALSLAYEGFERWYAALALLAVVPVAAHVAWRNRGYQTQSGHVLTQVGFWTRTTKVVPYYRLQTVVRSRNVFQRRRSLANLTADTAGSFSLRQRDATAVDIDDEDAARLRELLRERLQESLRARRRRLRSGAERDAERPRSGEGAETKSPSGVEESPGDGGESPPPGGAADAPPRDAGTDDESDESPPN